VALVLRNRLFTGVLVSLGSVGAALIGFFAGVAPAACGLSTRIEQTVSRIDPENRRPFAAFEYQEDSLVYLTRGRVRRPATAEMEQWVATHPNGLVSTRGHEPVLSRSLWEPIAEITGINVAKGRRDTVVLWQRSAER